VGGQSRAEQINQFLIHESVIVRNSQRDHPLAGDFLREMLAQPVGMLVLHAEDEVGPPEVASGDLDPRAVLSAGAAGLVVGMVLEEGLGGG